MTIETWPIERIKPYPQNARKIPKAAVTIVARSLKEYGWQQPIVVDNEGVIVVGHVRRLGALENGWTEAPVHVATELTPAQCRAYRLADNRSHEEAGWDNSLLGIELAGLADLKFDLSLTGFGEAELGRLLPRTDAEPEAQMDRAEELQAKWKVERGQVWEIGEHRLMCGDSSYSEIIDAFLGAHIPDLVLTDPPYGVDIEYGEFGSDRPADVRALINRFVPLVRRYPVVLLTSGHRNMWAYPPSDWMLVWVHPAGMGRGPWGFNWTNPILAYGKDPYLKAQLGGRQDCLVLAADRQGVEGHPVPKPLKVWTWLMERGSPKRGELVFDGFLGSGTTMVAAQNLGRRCYGMEIEPKYCAVILERMTAMGLKPKLEAHGKERRRKAAG